MKLSKYICYVAVCISALCLISCGSRHQYNYTYTFSGNIWNHFVPITDTFSITNTRTAYDMDIHLSVWDNFEHSLIPIQIILTYPDGQENVFTKYLSVKDIEGKHLGDVTGDVWTVSMNVFTNRTFAHEGNYTIDIQNTTQYYDLPNVQSVSYTLYTHKK